MASETGLVHNNGRIHVQVICWIARIAASLMAGLMLRIFIGEGLASRDDLIPHLTMRETAMMVAFAAA